MANEPVTTGSNPQAASPLGTPSIEQAPPPRKKPMSALTIVLIIIGVLALGCAGVFTAGFFWVKNKAEDLVAQAGDGGFGFVVSSPDQVRAELKGPRKDYVGHWRTDNGSTLDISSTGELAYNRIGEHGHTSYTMPIAGFNGADIVCKAFITITIKVSQLPHEVDGKWEMVADDGKFHREAAGGERGEEPSVAQ